MGRPNDGGNRGGSAEGGGGHSIGEDAPSSLHAPRSPSPDEKPGGSRLSVVVDDLAFFSGDAIARPVSAELGATTPLGRRLELAALDGERGERLAAQLRPAEPLAVGSAVVTGAGALPVELLVHAVVQSVAERVTRDGVSRATASALQRAAAFEVRHLGLPPFGTGAGNLDAEDSAQAMVEAIVRHLSRSALPARVTVVVESDLEREAFASRIAWVTSS